MLSLGNLNPHYVVTARQIISGMGRLWDAHSVMRAQMRNMVKLRPVIHGTFGPRVHQARCSTDVVLLQPRLQRRNLKAEAILCETNVHGYCLDISHGKQVIASNDAIFCALAGREVGSVYSPREQSGCAWAIPYEGVNENGEGTTSILAQGAIWRSI